MEPKKKEPFKIRLKISINKTLSNKSSRPHFKQAKEKTKYGEAAEILYDLLGDIDIISERIPILVACNKQDIPFAKNALQIERELTNEIEQIRKVRKATQQQEQDTAARGGQEESDQDEDGVNTTAPGYLESLKGRFSFDQVPNKV